MKFKILVSFPFPSSNTSDDQPLLNDDEGPAKISTLSFYSLASKSIQGVVGPHLYESGSMLNSSGNKVHSQRRFMLRKQG